MYNDNSIEAESFNRISAAIVLRAAKDYAHAYTYLKKNKHQITSTRLRYERLLKDCTDFFKSKWYSELCDVDGDYAIKTIQDKINTGKWESLQGYAK